MQSCKSARLRHGPSLTANTDDRHNGPSANAVYGIKYFVKISKHSLTVLTTLTAEGLQCWPMCLSAFTSTFCLYRSAALVVDSCVRVISRCKGVSVLETYFSAFVGRNRQQVNSSCSASYFRDRRRNEYTTLLRHIHGTVALLPSSQRKVS